MLTIEPLSVSFQAIADILTGQCVGYEILARPGGGPDQNVREFFAGHHALDELAEIEIAVRRAAARLAPNLPDLPNRLLFLNLDTRLIEQSGAVIDAGQALLAPFARQLVTEITSRHLDLERAQGWVNDLHQRRGLVALDRFGETERGLAFLLHCEIDYLKITRSLISGIDRIARQRVMLSQLVATAHTIGMRVIAVGIESEAELKICRELGCDLAQGYFIQPPVNDPRQAGIYFEPLALMAREERDLRLMDDQWIMEQLDQTPPLLINTPMSEVFATVARDPTRSLLPVVDENGQPLGVVREQALRNHVYSTYGKELIANRSLGFSLRSFLERTPVAALSTPLDRLLGLYSIDETAEGIIITEQNRYIGFLSARSIIRAMHEKTLARARDENPLTKLPGNDLIVSYVDKLLRSRDSAIIAYLDFDNFKPFNDNYGFRQGDRAILLFAELLRKMTQTTNAFIGHIGGDDFFVGLAGYTPRQAEILIAGLIEKFASDAESFYDSETRQAGYMLAVDRDGLERRFPLLSVSAVLLVIEAGDRGHSIDDISKTLAKYKKLAKSAPNRCFLADLASDKSRDSNLALR